MKSRLVFTFLVLAHSGSPGKRAAKWVCVCAISILRISNHNSFRVLFDKIASVYFIRKIYLYFSIGNGQPMEPALCQLYRHTFVPYTIQYVYYKIYNKIRTILENQITQHSLNNDCSVRSKQKQGKRQRFFRNKNKKYFLRKK